ncbi:unnamed protein product [Echinostoma caproni]|uniref:RNase III domain-containing protein n=1 Tax=Echinostoma caproni TaxID=27848 RepID=A0A182ZZN2_9TREM|nr:unnamed protein product [Echinostoma caproni]
MLSHLTRVDAYKHRDRLYSEFNRKSLSDMMEALLGYLLSHFGLQSASMLLLGNVPEPPINSRSVTIQKAWPNLFKSEHTLWAMYSPAETPQPCPNSSWSAVEKVLGYKFNVSSNFIAALTHRSFVAQDTSETNKIHYERLEFLGDAVLDFVITSHIYTTNSDFNPVFTHNLHQRISFKKQGNEVNLVWVAASSRFGEIIDEFLRVVHDFHRSAVVTFCEEMLVFQNVAMNVH